MECSPTFVNDQVILVLVASCDPLAGHYIGYAMYR